ncbi:MAG: VWA domain-containing protein [Rubrivivax sp.]|nr:MAG: VWA domain-containing protein [Rubrivivax sp.]
MPIHRNPPGLNLKTIAAGAALLLSSLLPAGSALAAVGVSWVSPLNNSVFNAGSIVSLSGAANASGISGGTGLDLALVLDSSGSMGTVSGGKTRQAWVREAAAALVNAVPQSTTSVAVVEFDSDANLLKALSPLTGDKAAVLAAINAVDASGNTNIGAGIDKAKTELIGPHATAGRIQVQVVLSDGVSSGNPTLSASNAFLAGVEAVHTVGIPGHSVATMQAIATAGHGTYTNGTDLTALLGLFNGTGGNLVGIDKVDVTLNDGTVLHNVAIDGLGNFVLPSITVFAGDNLFTAQAFDTLGNSAVAQLHLTGAVPEPETLALLMAGLVVCGVSARARSAKVRG